MPGNENEFLCTQYYTNELVAGNIDYILLTEMASRRWKGGEGGEEFICTALTHMTHSQMLGKFEYTRGPIFKVVLEC